MKTRSSQRTGLKNVTNIGGNGRVSKPQRKNNSRPKPSHSKDKDANDKSSSPLKPLDAHITPKKIKNALDLNNGNSIVNTPRTPSSVFQAAKSAFRRCSTPAKLIGRDEERQTIEAFIKRHVINGKPGALYISGCPGTGKTALLNESNHKIMHVFINCMNISASKGIFAAISSEIDPNIKVSKNSYKALEDTLLPSEKSNMIYFVILDEIDQLVTSDNQVLYTLFEWASMKESKLVLIGIANALNLTDRFLPRLKSAPGLLNFNPYKVNEISAIIQNRLMSVADTENENKTVEVPLMQKAAIEIAARKIASGGDLRKALDICRRAIELVETEAQASQSETLSVSNFNSPIQSIDEVPKVNIRHIITASSSLNDNQSTVRLNELHTNQKLILVTMVTLQDRLGEIQKLDKAIPKSVNRMELNTDLITVLENSGLISFKSAKKSKESLQSMTLALNIRSEDIIKSCKGSHLLEKIIQQEKRFK